MPPWVAFPSLILLWADVVVSQTRVTGVVGQSVTLPCTYSTAHEIAPMCWGQGPCSLFRCSNKLISTDGYHITFKKDKRYRMNGIISRGDLSLTIQNAALSDTGIYCCRVELIGWFNDYKGRIFLEIKPAPTTAPTPPKVFSSTPTTPATTKNLKTAPPKVTSVPTSPKVFTSAPTTPAPTLNLKTAPPNVTMGPTSPIVSMSTPTKPAGGQQTFKTDHFSLTSNENVVDLAQLSTGPQGACSGDPLSTVKSEPHLEETTSSFPVQTTETAPITPRETSTTSSSLNSSCPTDGNSTVTLPSYCSWQYNETHTILKQNIQRNTSKLYIGLSIAAMILLTSLAAILTKKYLCGKRTVLQISKEPQTGTSQNGTAVRYQAQENIYFENDLYNMP